MLMQTDPFRDLDVLLSRLGSRVGADGSTMMPMDAYRRGDSVWVHLDMPGVTANSIDVDIERNVLTVSAERSWDPEEDDQMYLSERRQGTYRRQVQLGDGLDAEAVEASLSDGVLTLRIPVAEVAKPRRIAVTSKQPAIDVDIGGENPSDN